MLLLRKTSEKNQGREIWTLTWLDPNGLVVPMEDLSRTWQENMNEFRKKATTLFRSLTEKSTSFPRRIKINHHLTIDSILMMARV